MGEKYVPSNERIAQETGLKLETVDDLLNAGWTYVSKLHGYNAFLDPSYQLVLRESNKNETADLEV